MDKAESGQVCWNYIINVHNLLHPDLWRYKVPRFRNGLNFFSNGKKPTMVLTNDEQILRKSVCCPFTNQQISTQIHFYLNKFRILGNKWYHGNS